MLYSVVTKVTQWY